MTTFMPLDIPPGVYRNGTEFQAQGRYYDADLIRWVDKTLRPMNGWRPKTETVLVGAARRMHQWRDNSDNGFAAIGTHTKFYAMDRGAAIYDITPLRGNGSLGTDPVDTTDTDETVTITHTAHGLTAGDTVILAGLTDTGGLVINGTRLVATVPDPDTFTFEHASPATSTATGGGAGGTYEYEITIGMEDAVAEGGFGDGIFGDDEFGTPRADISQIQDATAWAIDTWGQYINAIRNDGSGVLYEWTLNTSNRMAAVVNSPTGKSLVTTAEGFVFVLAAGANDRKVQWCDQADNTVWTPSATNQAGSYTIETTGRLMQGLRVGGGTLLITDADAWIARYTSNVSVYTFNRLAGGCGVVSRKAAAAIGEIAIWMGDGQFWIYNGFVQPLHCDVEDYVFGNMNRLQRSKITTVVNTEFTEIIWWYPSDDGVENDRYVKYNINDQIWDIGTGLARTCGTDRDAFEYPIYVDSGGIIYEQEVGWNYDGATPYAEGGPLAFGDGDRFVRALSLVPDERTLGDVTATFLTRNYPTAAESTFGPYTLANPTDVRFQGRQFKVRFTGSVLGDWRVGKPRIGVITGDAR
jgi:hypothetical protein